VAAGLEVLLRLQVGLGQGLGAGVAGFRGRLLQNQNGLVSQRAGSCFGGVFGFLCSAALRGGTTSRRALLQTG
jgi:hypothetical protein